MKFPELPDDLSIGEITLRRKRSIVFTGITSRESPADLGIPTGKVKIIVHEKGLRLRNYNNKTVMDIHNAQLIGLNIETEIKSFQKNRNVILRALFRFLALITLGAMMSDLSDDPSTYSKEVAYLVIDFRDPASRSAQKIYISSKKKQIDKFLEVFD